MTRDACPTPLRAYERVVLAHGGGGRLTADLVSRVFLPALAKDPTAPLEDAAIVDAGAGARLAITTDSFVVRPLFFPGGDIGRLAVCGTVNDLAVAGAHPRHLAAAFILEEGLPIADLERVVASMRACCDEAGVALVTGDTKVVERGKGDQIFITTTGVGLVPPGRKLSITGARPGDRVVVSGTLGDHGVAILAVREGIALETRLESDCAPLQELVRLMLEVAPGTRCLRDPTRGGAASTLNELAAASRVGVRLDEARLPLRAEVKAACDVLGLDPLYVANEGKVVAVVPPDEVEALLAAMRTHRHGRNAAVIGEIVDDHHGAVVLRSRIGGERLVAMLAGEQLPRIC